MVERRRASAIGGSNELFIPGDGMPRIQDIAPDELDAEQKRVCDAIVSGPRGVVQGPLRVWLHSPQLADRAQALGAFCRYGTGLEQRLSELAILVTGAYWKAGFEWHVHAPIAVEAGLDPLVVEALRRGEPPRFSHADEAAVYTFARELLTSRCVSNETYAQVERALGPRNIVELVGILGYYALISMTIVAFELAVPPGIPDPFEN
jgi:4-carboxymuconolactone decarboxylase